MKGRITQSTGSWYVIRTADQQEVKARLKGKFKITDHKTTNPIAVGDYVLCEPESASDAWIITDILPRRNAIVRKSPRRAYHTHTIAANIDQLLLIITFSQPRTALGFIDRFLVTAEYDDIDTILVFNKQDLYDESDMEYYEAVKAMYEELGYQTVLVSAETGFGMSDLQNLLNGKTNLLTGVSGVGKSTLLNQLYPDLQLKTQEISDYSGKGQHTTTFATLFETAAFDTSFIDTPGIKLLELVAIEPQQVGFYFREIKRLAQECKFSDCMHLDEPKCAVKAAVIAEQISDSRYNSYVKIVTDIENVNYWERL